MTIQEACKILGVTSQEDDRTIKLKFRKLMTQYHPDAVGSDSPEHLKKAQLLNEAYAVLRKKLLTNKDRVVKRAAWKGKVKKELFAERIIYMSGLSWEGYKTEFYEVARGKYEWDPDLEEFECFLRSLNQVVLELLENTERENEIYNDYEYDIKAQRFAYQLKLFHVLAGQYIPSISCLKKLAEPEETDKQGRKIYRFQSFLGAQGAGGTFTSLAKLKEGDLIYAASLQNNRIMVSDGAGTMLGHLSFPDDQLYYVIIPILQNHMAQVKFIVREIEVNRKRRPHRVKVNVDLYLRMEKEVEESAFMEQNRKIKAIINEYDYCLKKLI